MEPTSGYRSERSGSPGMLVQEDTDWIMDRIESYFVVLEAIIKTRRQFYFEADVTHPDGFAVRVSAQCYAGVDNTKYKTVDILRCSGDALLFHMVYQQFLAFDLGRGTWPKKFYDGQLCPRATLKALPPCFDPPVFTLDPGGMKRKPTDEPT